MPVWVWAIVSFIVGVLVGLGIGRFIGEAFDYWLHQE